MNSALLPPPPSGRSASFRALLAGLVALGLPFTLPAADEPKAEDPKTTPAAETAEAESTETQSEKAASEEAPAEEATKEDPAAEPEPGEFRNWFDLSVGGLIVKGDDAAAQRRLGLPATAVGGVQSFHFEQDVGKTGVLKIDGRGIVDNEDYGLRLDYTDSEKGFVRAGVDQYRTFSDGSGGWLPRNDAWFDLYDDRLDLVRGTAFFEAGLRLPKLPEITVRYEHDWRDGQKDSTIWGDTALTGGTGPRALVPTFLDLDEKRDTLSLDIRKTLGKTTLGGTFVYETSDLENGRYMRRHPGEAGTADRHITQTERVDTDLYNARAFVDTIFNPKVRMTTAYAFTTLDTDLGGSRVLGSDYDAIYDPVYGRRDVGFLNLAGGSRLDQHVWNANVMWNPIAHLAVIPAFRLENQSVDGDSSWLDTGIQDIARSAANSRDRLDLSQQLEVRYTGVTNVVVYARGDWVQGDGNLLEQQQMSGPTLTELYRDTDFDRLSQKYTAGASWYPLRRVNLHLQYYRKMREDNYDTDPSSYLNLSPSYPGFIENHDFTTDDVNFRVTWRPLDKLTLVTRYDFQLNTIDMAAAGLGSQEAGESTAHIISETITWTPLSWLYVQPGFNYVMDETTSAASTTVTGTGSPLEDARNDYLNVHCGVGLVLDDRTDLQFQYNYYLADNFEDVSDFTQPYGAGTEEHGILTSVVRRISKKLRVAVRYGFYTSRSEMAGGYNDYDAHLVYTTAQYLF